MKNTNFHQHFNQEGNVKINDDFIVDAFTTNNELFFYQNGARNVGLWESEKMLFQKYIHPNDKILDIGCGAGRTTFGLYNLGYRNIVGIDITPAMVDSAKQISKEKGLSIDFTVGDAKNINMPTNSCDAVLFSFNGLMMIPKRKNRVKAMREIARILKDKGYFVFTTHDRNLKGNPSRENFRKEEEKKRKEGSQNRELFEYGDMVYKNKDGQDIFLHIPNQEEMLGCIQEAGLTVVEHPLRSEITNESDVVKEFSKECRFWVTQKIEK